MKCPLLHGNIQKAADRETEKSMPVMLSGGFVIPAVQNNALFDST